jgi:hypothetical protein
MERGEIATVVATSDSRSDGDRVMKRGRGAGAAGGLEEEGELQEKEIVCQLSSLWISSLSSLWISSLSSLWVAWLFVDHASLELTVCGTPKLPTTKDWLPYLQLTADLTRHDNRGPFSPLCVCTKSGMSGVNHKRHGQLTIWK